MAAKTVIPVWNVDPTVLLADVAVDRAAVYLAGFPYAIDEPRLVAVPRDRSERRVLLGPEHAPVNLVVADDEGCFVSVEQALLAVDPATGRTRKVATTPATLTLRLLLDGGCLYGASHGGVYRVPRGGGALDWLARGRGMAVAADGARVAWVVDGRLWLRVGEAPAHELGAVTNPHTLAFSGGSLVVAEFDQAGSLWAIDLLSGERRALARGGYYSQVVAHEGWVYVTQAILKSGPWIFRVRLATGEVQPLVRGRSKGGRLALGAGLLAWIGDTRGGAGALEMATLAG